MQYARDNIEYVSGDATTFPEGLYDLVFANQVADKDLLFRRVYQSLKSGGRFAFVAANGNLVHTHITNSYSKADNTLYGSYITVPNASF